MKFLCSGFLLAITSLSSAATVTYNFEAASNAATVTGTGFSTTALTETGATSGGISTGAIYGGFTGTLAPTATSTVRAFLPSQVTNQSNPSVTTGGDYVQFTITPDAGQTLSFAGATVAFDIGAATGFASNLDMQAYARMGYRINTGTFTALGGGATGVTAPAYAASADNWTGQASFNNTANSFKLVETTFSTALPAISGLNPGDSVTFRIAIGDTSGITRDLTLGPGGATKTLYLDDITVFGFTVVPEPSAMLLSGLGIAALAFRRRL